MAGGRFVRATAWLMLAGGGATGWLCAVADAEAPGHRDVIVVGVSADRATVIAAAAQAARRDIATLLFGSAGLQPWAPACTIHVHPDRAAFARAVGAAPAVAGGATSIEFTGDAVSLRRIDVIDVTGGGEQGVPAALAHEMVHVVLADRFTAGPPPRWADEGLATLFDEATKRQGHEADYRAAAVRGQAWSVADLMALDLDPADVARQRVFYGQSVALVRWLIARADGPTFLRFIDAAAVNGVNPALRAHYGFESVASLERAWQTEPAPPPVPPATPARPNPGPAEPGPGA